MRKAKYKTKSLLRRGVFSLSWSLENYFSAVKRDGMFILIANVAGEMDSNKRNK
jgi:hypothetical protein